MATIPAHNARTIIRKITHPAHIQIGDATQTQDQFIYPVNLRPIKRVVNSIAKFLMF